jgi:hypothetical protein
LLHFCELFCFIRKKIGPNMQVLNIPTSKNCSKFSTKNKSCNTVPFQAALTYIKSAPFCVLRPSCLSLICQTMFAMKIAKKNKQKTHKIRCKGFLFLFSFFLVAVCFGGQLTSGNGSNFLCSSLLGHSSITLLCKC